MTQEQNTLFDSMISRIDNSSSSIFAKNDVINLIASLQEQFTSLPETTPTTGYDIDTIVKAAGEVLDNYPFEDCIEVEPELNGGYSGNYSLEFNTSFDDRSFIRNFSEELSEILQQDKK
jgi:hypothetical protein